MNPSVKISAGQVYQGTASRYLFPPDHSDWWNCHGSYEVTIIKTGRIWFEYQSYYVFKDGRRDEITSKKRARLAELQKEIDAGLMALKTPDIGKITLEPLEE